MKLMLRKPVVFARKKDIYFLAEEGHADNPEATGQFWSQKRGYSSLWKLAALKRFTMTEPVDPPQPWKEPRG